MSKYTALIAGATGAASIRLVERLLLDPEWSVVGLCRHPPDSANQRLHYHRADLLDRRDTQRAIASHANITHAFYTSRAPFAEGGVEDVAANCAMLENTIDALQANCADTLQHIHLVEGSKWYGVHVGPSPSPAREDAARHMPPNFYYDQQDMLAARQVGQRWSWSASRPNVIYDFAPQRTRNLVPTLGVWAAMSKELGLALDFPGRNYDRLTDLSDATQLANGMVWMATSSAASNQAFNLTDGDFFRWRELFAAIAQHFDMPLGQARPLNVESWMADKAPLWQRIVDRHGLAPSRLDNMAAWGFVDFLFKQNFDVVSSMVKIRQSGFHDTVDTVQRFIDHLQSYQNAGLLPRFR